MDYLCSLLKVDGLKWMIGSIKHATVNELHEQVETIAHVNTKSYRS